MLLNICYLVRVAQGFELHFSLCSFFPGYAYAIPLMLMDLPILFLEVLPYCILVYWIAGFAAKAGQVCLRPQDAHFPWRAALVEQCLCCV